MTSQEIYTVGDLIRFLLQFDPHKRVMVYDHEYGIDNPLQHIDIEDDKVVIYD